MKQPPINKFPQGLARPKPPSQYRLRSALSISKTNPVPEQKLKPTKTGSALKAINIQLPKPHYTAATKFKA